MLQVGLTGGIASGKSTVSALLAERGAHLIDSDAIAREVVEPGTPGLAAVAAEFGAQVLADDGSLDRAALAAVVFADDAARTRLNAIVHPLVRQRSEARVAALPVDAVVVQDVPLLVENGMGAAFPLVVVVHAAARLRLQRAVARGLDPEQARARMESQVSDEQRRRAADAWLVNEGSREELETAVRSLWEDRVVPFARNLRAGRAADAGRWQRDTGATARVDATARLAARLLRAADGAWTAVVPVVGSGRPLQLRAVRGSGAEPSADRLAQAGFVALTADELGNADPGQPATVHVTG